MSCSSWDNTLARRASICLTVRSNSLVGSGGEPVPWSAWHSQSHSDKLRSDSHLSSGPDLQCWQPLHAVSVHTYDLIALLSLEIIVSQTGGTVAVMQIRRPDTHEQKWLSWSLQNRLRQNQKTIGGRGIEALVLRSPGMKTICLCHCFDLYVTWGFKLLDCNGNSVYGFASRWSYIHAALFRHSLKPMSKAMSQQKW